MLDLGVLVAIQPFESPFLQLLYSCNVFLTNYVSIISCLLFYDTNLYMVLPFFLIFYNEIIVFEDKMHKKYFNKRYVL